MNIPPSSTHAAPLQVFTSEGRNGAYTAETEAEGVCYSATSTKSPVFKLCRVMQAAGIADGPYQIVTKSTGTLSYSGSSWCKLAGLTVIENATEGPKLATYKPKPAGLWRNESAGQTTGSAGVVEGVGQLSGPIPPMFRNRCT